MPSSPDPGANWQPETLAAVEKQLAAFIGPVAKVIVKKAASKSADLHELYRLAGESLPAEDKQAFFRGEAELRQSGSEPRSGHPVEAAHGVRPLPSPRSDDRLAAEPKSGAATAAAPAPQPHAHVDAGPPAAVPAQPQVKSDSLRQRPTPVAPPKASTPWEDLLGKPPESLAGYLQDQPVQLELVIHAFIATVEALLEAYAQNLLLEPLSPQTICFDAQGKATIRRAQPTAKPVTGPVVGNPRYAVPEVFAEKATAQSNTAAAHVYALGLMFYEILLGKELFARTFADQRSDLDWLAWHADLKAKAPALKSLLPDCPAAMSDLLETMMQKDSEKRNADLTEILKTLRDLAQRSNKTLVLRKQQFAAAPARLVEPELPTEKSGKAWIVVALMVVLAIAGFFLWQDPSLYLDLISRIRHLAQTP